MRNLKEITPILVGIELGQDLYIPDYANNPLMLFKKNCPIWIKINEDGDCIVHPISDEENWEDEIDAVIRENIEKGKESIEKEIKRIGFNYEDLFLEIYKNCEIKPVINQIETHVMWQQWKMHEFLKKYNCIHESRSPL